MNKDRINTSHLLQKNQEKMTAIDIEDYDKALLSDKDQIKTVALVEPIATRNLFTDISDANKLAYNDFIRKIGLSPEWASESLRSYLSRLEEDPVLATYIVFEIIGKAKIWYFEEELQTLNDSQGVSSKLIFERKITNGQ